jgi:hypothetical protein
MFRRPEISTRHLRIALFEIFVGLLHLACAINLESPAIVHWLASLQTKFQARTAWYKDVQISISCIYHVFI